MYKLLIVDDESEIRQGLSNYYPWANVGLECLGFVEDAQEAVAFLKEHDVDVVLSDIVMPNMSGIDLAKYIYESGIKTKIVFLSGYKDFEYAQKAIEYGVCYYLLKPAKYDDLTETFTKIRDDLDHKNAIKTNNVYTEYSQDNIEMACISEQHIRNIKGFIKANYKTVTLCDVASFVHMHPFYVSKVFKQKTGQTFSDYLIEIKMKKAADMLADFNLKTYEISEMVGYTNSRNFTRAFKSFFGITPREYKNRSNIK